MARDLQVADVLTVQLPEHVPPGHEQNGYRPAIVVGLPERLGTPRFPNVIVVPLTSEKGREWSGRAADLYPTVRAGRGGLTRDSVVLIDQIRAIDLSRVVRYIGTLSSDDFRPIKTGLAKLLELA